MSFAYCIHLGILFCVYIKWFDVVMNLHFLFLPEYTKLEVAIINLDTVQFNYINIEPVTVSSYKNESFYNGMRECVCMSHMT